MLCGVIIATELGSSEADIDFFPISAIPNGYQKTRHSKAIGDNLRNFSIAMFTHLEVYFPLVRSQQIVGQLQECYKHKPSVTPHFFIFF